MLAKGRSAGNYRPDIDGLRAIAVGAVVAFHTFPNIFKGGFVGVDVFFVISGFLISGILVDDIEEDRFSYLDFYKRRIRRIFPALLVVIAATLVAGWYVLLPDEFQRVGKDLAAGAGFATNFILWGEAGYFDVASETKPLLHLWSLAIEEQFYIVWPLVLGLIWARQRGLLLAALSIASVSFAYNVFSIEHHHADAAFYSPLSRFWELMLGGALAYLVRQKAQWLSGFRSLQSAFGLLLIANSIFFLNRTAAFPGFWALLPTLGAFFVISAGGHNWIGKHILGNPIMVGVGLISYPLYLWHWPILVFAKIVKGRLLTPGDRMMVIIASVALAFLTYRFIERPLRRSLDRRVPQGLLAAVAALGVIGLAILNGNVLSRLRNEHITQILAAGYDWEYPPVASENHSLGGIRYFRESSELNSYTLYIGDSNIEQYAPRIDYAIKNSPTQMRGAIMLGNQEQCDVLADIISAADQCPSAMRQQLTAWLSQESIGAVAIAASWLHYKELLEKSENQGNFARFLLSIQQSKGGYLILASPHGEELAPARMFAGSRLKKITAKPITEIHFDFGRFEQRYKDVNKILSEIASRSGVVLIDPVSYLCPDRQCPVVDETGKPLYLDAGHLTRSYAVKAATFIDATLIPTPPRRGIVRTEGLSPL
ncbi:MAG: acyltransferase family protein [Xanthobacteraceae bacterium]